MKRLIISYGLFVVDVEKKRFTSHWMQQQFGKVASKMQQSCGTPAHTYNTHAEEIEIKIEKENKEKQSACVCLDDTQQSDEGGAREQMPVVWRRLTIMPTGKMSIRFDMEYITCTRCGQTLPRSKLERMKTSTYRSVCNHSKWLYYVKPSRDRRILRDLEDRHHHPDKK